MLCQIQGLQPKQPANSITETYATGYGRAGSLTINGNPHDWLALAHPGLLKAEPRQVPIDLQNGPDKEGTGSTPNGPPAEPPWVCRRVLI